MSHPTPALVEQAAPAANEGARAQPTLPSRLPGIDVVRAVAALAVLVSHVAFVSETASYGLVVRLGQHGLGAAGVRLFFVLSGLCIHLPLARRLASDPDAMPAWGPYFRRRFTRIYPPHLVALVLSAVVGLALAPSILASTPITPPTVRQFVLHLAMVHSFVPDALKSINGVLWSIAVETHFYLLYPLLLVARRRLGMGGATAALFALSLFIRFSGLVPSDELRNTLELNVPGSFWEWALGCWLAERLVATGQPATSRDGLFTALCAGALLSKPILTAAGRLLLGPELGRLVAGHVFATGSPFLYAAVVYVACGLRFERPGAVVRALEWAGLRSYSLYLIHPLAIAGMALGTSTLGLPGWGLATVVNLAGSLLLTAAFFRWVERPFLTRAAKMSAAPIHPK
jgi:peptidoglycan/LPS O-acetylase OafA/YrhL